MPALALVDLALVAEGPPAGLAEAPREPELGLVGHLPGLAGVLSDVEPAVRAVEGDPLALVRHVGVEGVGEEHSVLVLDLHGHRVVARDVGVPDAAVAVVAVLVLALHVELAVPLALGNVVVEVALVLEVAAPAFLAAELVVRSVEIDLALGLHAHRIGAEPPVHLVEVV